MGSFSMTCSFSGLGIAAGTPVRAFLLTESPYFGRGEGAWSVRTPPLRACYDDYGSIDRVHPKDAHIAKLWLRGLREDLVELGTGANQCHDVPTRRDMSFDEFLDALTEGRIYVRQDTENFWRRPRNFLDDISAEDRARARLIPSLQGIEAILERDKSLQEECGGRVTGTGLFCGKFVLDEPRPRLVRVRWEKTASTDPNRKYIPEEESARDMRQLQKVKSLVDYAGFTSCIIASTDCSEGSVELVVFAAPHYSTFHAGPEWYSGKKETPGGADAPLRVSLALVREDVWQAACRFPQKDSVDLDCRNCGQQSYYHGKKLQCPNKSINNKPFKKRPKGSRYEHGPVFPAEVRHRVVQRPYGEDVWYDVGAYRYAMREAWASVIEYFREKTPAELRAQRRRERRALGKPTKAEKLKAEKILAKMMQAAEKFRQKRKLELAKLSPEDRKARIVKEKETSAQWAREKEEKKKNPIFGDFLFNDAMVEKRDAPGVWILHSRVPGVIAISEHLAMYLADKKRVPLSVLDGIAELAAVSIALTQIRRRWEPASSFGAQSPEWEFHSRFAELLARIAETEIGEQNNSPYRDKEDPLLKSAPLTFKDVPD